MGRRRRQVIVEVSPTRHEIVVLENGALRGVRTARLSLGETSADWAEGLLTLEQKIAGWVAELDISGCTATVVYSSPDSAAIVCDCPVAGGEARAKLAAKVAIAGTLSYPIEQNAHGEFCVFKDGSAPEDEQPKYRTLAMADTDASIMSLSLVLERAGLRPTGFLPAQGASLAAAIREFAQCKTAEKSRVVLWVGEHSSVIVAGVDDRLALARLVPVGTETLVEALARPVAVGEHRTEPLMNRKTACEILFTAGIPTLDGWQGSSEPFEVKAILPLVQPPLQRLIVELKQSIRFGLSREVREHAVLRVCGPGSQILGLPETVVHGVGLEIDNQDASKDCSLAQHIHSDIVAAISLGKKVPVLVSREFAARKMVKTSQRALWAGAAAALLVIGIDMIDSITRTAAAEDALAQATMDATPLASVADQKMEVALAARHGLHHAKMRKQKLLDATPPYGAILAALAALTPEEVSLTEIAFAEEGDMARCTIRGWAVGDEEVTETDRFRDFVASIRACPLVADMTLGETRRSQEQDRQTLSFHMTLDLVELPVELVASGVAEDVGEYSP